MAERFLGTVKSFDRAKGQGFLAVEGGKDVFFHASQLPGDSARTLKEGQRVEFSIEQGARGPQAVKIVLG
jgi:CspA family cold shock protein